MPDQISRADLNLGTGGVASNNADQGAGQHEPGTNVGPTPPQDTNPAPFRQGFENTGGAEKYDQVRDGETLAAFADRHRVPVNAVRAANADSVDAYGNLLANTTRLVVPE